MFYLTCELADLRDGRIARSMFGTQLRRKRMSVLGWCFLVIFRKSHSQAMYCWFSGVLLRSHIVLVPEERYIVVIVRKGRRDVLRRCEDVGQVCSLNDPPCFLSSATQCLAALVSRRSCYVTHVLSFGKSLGGERELHVGHCWAMLAGSAPRVVISIALNVSWCFHTIPAWLDNWLHLTAGVSSVHLFFKVYNILFTIWTIWSCTLLLNMLLDQE